MKERYRILLLSSAILYSFYFVYDIPAALNKDINFGNEKYKEYKITLLYSIYALPNIIIPLFFGWVSKFSTNFIAQLLCLFVFTGNLIFSIGIYKSNFNLMLIGRFLFGIGGESFSVIQNKIISTEFKGKELSLALGLFSSLGRLGTVTNFLITPILSDKLGKTMPCLVGIFLTLFGFLLCVKICNRRVINGKYNQSITNDNIKETTSNNSKMIREMSSDNGSMTSNMNGKVGFPIYNTVEEEKPEDLNFNNEAILKENPFIPWQSEEKEYSDIVKTNMRKDNPSMLYEEKDTIFYEPALESYSSYHSAFPLLVLISFLFALIWAPFYTVAPMLFQKRFNVTAITSSRMLAFVEAMSLSLNLVTGALADHLGYKLYFICIGALIVILSHTSILLRLFSPYITVILLGLAGPCISCYWSCIPSLVSDDFLASGFAIVYCVLNFAFTFSPVLVAILVSKDLSYTLVEIYMVVVGMLALLFVSSLIFVNNKLNVGLNKKQMGGIEDE